MKRSCAQSLLVLLMLVVCLFAGCGGGENQEVLGASPTTSVRSEVSGEIRLCIRDGSTRSDTEKVADRYRTSVPGGGQELVDGVAGISVTQSVVILTLDPSIAAADAVRLKEMATGLPVVVDCN